MSCKHLQVLNCRLREFEALLKSIPQLRCSTRTCTVSEVENCGSLAPVHNRSIDSGPTLFDAVLVGVLLVHWLSVICTSDTLNALIKVVLCWGAGLRFLAFCNTVSKVQVSNNIAKLSRNDNASNTGIPQKDKKVSPKISMAWPALAALSLENLKIALPHSHPLIKYSSTTQQLAPLLSTKHLILLCPSP